ncbi:Bug family tripartite tricarboxylate transporter substrate binding protein [Propylenella binzhouense]|uniref:Tripartite tricarboxylate transporter substrate binding protein n=1 Tax=Propylenella binzhouense TaxID=2555902 RepID=A0A964WVT2_9HYPH|nr:tripartite tricarboxylate transporter substrate binding protein [Propylenella binzhouense]MYZ50150.1 tripartite tricarboxylate transporter substrate binding protein [Propylenella binzhouense]
MTALKTPGARNASFAVRAALAAGLIAGLPLAAAAQDKFPSQQIELISHAAPGGGTEQTMRMWMDEASKILGVDLVVVFKQGGGARTAHEYLKSRPADGYTLMGTTETHLYTIAQGKSPLAIDDLKGVVRAMQDPSVIVVRGDSAIENYDQLIAASKKGALNWGVAQVGGTEHIGIARWAEKAGVPYRVVPFGSGGEMITGLRSGAIDATVANISEAAGPIKDGDLRAIAVLADEPLAELPDVPTAKSKGADVSVNTTRGYVVLADTPPERVKILEDALLKAMQTEKFKTYLKNSGLDPDKSVAGSEDWDAQLKKDYANAKDAIDRLGLGQKK